MSSTTKIRIAAPFLFTSIIVGIGFAQSDSMRGEMKAPKLVNQPELTFPNEAYTGRVVGKVWLKVLVGQDGIPIKTDIQKRDPEMAYLFDNEARKWGMQCRFTPALDSDGKAVPMWDVIPLSFNLDQFTPPQCLKQAKPNYPQDALEMGMEGWVGIAVFVRSDGEPDGAQILVVAREPQNTTLFDIAAKETAYHSQYVAAVFQATSVDGWCFIKVPFKIATLESAEGQTKE